MRIQLIAKCESDMTGTSRYARDLYQGLTADGLDARLTFPMQTMIPAPVQNRLKRIKLDPEAFFASYPLRANLIGADVYHLTGQMLATLLLFQRFPKPVVVTVLDIIPYLVHRQPELNTFRHPIDYMFYCLALAGLRRANAIIAISEYTRKTLVEVLGLAAERIHVVYPAVDHDKFRPMVVPESFRSKYGLDEGERFVLFVGSEDPRKNLPTLIKAFALVKQQIPDIKLLKVGAAQFAQEREKLQTLIAQLELQHNVLFLNYVPDEDLPLFYNVADVFVMPSLYEGFGLPAAEAMACGTPLIYTCIGPMPEVIGDGGMRVCQYDTYGLAEAILALLKNEGEQLRLRRAGRQQAARFTLHRVATETREIYARMIVDT